MMAVLPALLGLTGLTTTSEAFAWGFWHGGYWGLGHEWNEGGSCCGYHHWGVCCDSISGSGAAHLEFGNLQIWNFRSE